MGEQKRKDQNMSRDIEEKVVFGLSSDDKGTPFVILAIPPGAWEYMKDGKTQTFDLSSVGVPIKIMMFGAGSHDDAMKLLTESFHAAGKPVFDERQKDFGIKSETE